MPEKMWMVRTGERAVIVQDFEDKNYVGLRRTKVI
jgi:hypothetical protein